MTGGEDRNTPSEAAFVLSLEASSGFSGSCGSRPDVVKGTDVGMSTHDRVWECREGISDLLWCLSLLFKMLGIDPPGST